MLIGSRSDELVCHGIRRSLSWIPEGDLFGIEEIVLEEQLGPATTTSPEWHHKIEGRNLAVGGQYFGPQGDLPASIVLYVVSLYRGIPKVYWLSPVITLQLARILAHEVGHHLIKQRGYVFERGERSRRANMRKSSQTVPHSVCVNACCDAGIIGLPIG